MGEVRSRVEGPALAPGGDARQALSLPKGQGGPGGSGEQRGWAGTFSKGGVADFPFPSRGLSGLLETKPVDGDRTTCRNPHRKPAYY